MNIAENFVATCRRDPRRLFVVGVDDVPAGYGEVLERARRFAGGLAARGIVPGDRVVLSFPNGVDYLTAYLGTLLFGCVAVLVDFRARAEHLDFVRRDSGAAAWVGPEDRPGASGVPDHVRFDPGLAAASPIPIDVIGTPADDLALIIYTSGTTGTPKGVRLTHANLQHTIRSITRWAQIDESDRELTTLSLTHLFGLAHVHVHWTLGGAVVLEDALRDIPRVLGRMARHAVTSFPGTPAGYKLILDGFRNEFRSAAASLRYMIVNSAPMAPEYVRLMLDTVPAVRFYMYYGLTEASRSTFIHYNKHPGKLATVGTPTPGAEVMVGSSPDRPLVDEPGEILVRGPHVTPGYWGIDSSPHFVDGWFRTGDLGVIDQDGFLSWTGRVKEQINVDGLKVSPAEIEEVLRTHPRVRDCAVVGAPDPLTGQVVVGFVVPDTEGSGGLEPELRRHCKGKLEFYKIPRRIHVIDEIPRTDSGKVKRLALLERLPS